MSNKNSLVVAGIGYSAFRQGPWQAVGWLYLLSIFAQWQAENEEREIILAYAESPKHIRHLAIVYHRLRKYGLTQYRIENMNAEQIFDFARDIGIYVTKVDLLMAERDTYLIKGDYKALRLERINHILFRKYGRARVFMKPDYLNQVPQIESVLQKKANDRQFKKDALKVTVVLGGILWIISSALMALVGGLDDNRRRY